MEDPTQSVGFFFSGAFLQKKARLTGVARARRAIIMQKRGFFAKKSPAFGGAALIKYH
jgi:hypothetical protein